MREYRTKEYKEKIVGNIFHNSASADYKDCDGCQVVRVIRELSSPDYDRELIDESSRNENGEYRYEMNCMYEVELDNGRVILVYEDEINPEYKGDFEKCSKLRKLMDLNDKLNEQVNHELELLNKVCIEKSNIICTEFEKFVKEMMMLCIPIRDGKTYNGYRLNFDYGNYEIYYSPRYSDGSGAARLYLREKYGKDYSYFNVIERPTDEECDEKRHILPELKEISIFIYSNKNLLAMKMFFCLNAAEIMQLTEMKLCEYVEEGVKLKLKKLSEKREECSKLTGTCEMIA